MRAYAPALIAALSLAVAGAASAQDTTMQGMPMDAKHKPAARSGKGTGVIRAVDPKAGTVTIQHGPIPAVGWPAMTMAFKARPAVLKGVKVGEKVSFDVTVAGMAGEVTAVRPQ